MGNILLFVESRFKVDRKRIRKVINDFLDRERIRGKVEVNIAIVGDRRMKKFNKTFRDRNETTPVLSFPLEEPYKGVEGEGIFGFVYPPDGILRLGDVIISYPQVVETAASEEILVDDKIEELIIHGLNNLVGKINENAK